MNKTPSPSPNDWLFRALLALVVAAPLPLAANRPWSWSLLCLVTALLCVAWGWLAASGRTRIGMDFRRLWPLAIPYLAALIWAFVQTLAVVPASAAHPIWSEAASILALPTPQPVVSADPELTRIAIMRALAYGGVFLLAAQLGCHRGRTRQGLRAVTWAALAYSTYGLAMHIFGIERILWIEKWAYVGDATGTFVSRNAFGALAGLGAVLCTAMAVASRGGGPVTDRVERLLTRAMPWAAGATICFLALLASHSRGALLATVGGGFAILACMAMGRMVRPFRAAMLTAAMIAIAGILALSAGEKTLTRFTSESDRTGDRPNLTRLTLDAIADAPLTGHGFGAYERAFLPYRDLTLPRAIQYDRAHNFWLELAMELGLPAATGLVAGPLLVVAACVRGLRVRRRDQVFPAVAIAAATLFGLHGVVDFTISMPALASILAFLLGLGYAQSWPSDSRGSAMASIDNALRPANVSSAAGTVARRALFRRHRTSS